MVINLHKALVHQENSPKKKDQAWKNRTKDVVVHFKREEEDIALIELEKEEEEETKKDSEGKVDSLL